MKRLQVIMVLSLAVGLAADSASAREFIVDQRNPAASDSNAGTSKAPLKTIGKAASMVQPGDTVLIKVGVYREVVELKTSGTEGKPVTLKAAPGERVVVSGAEPITGWRKATKGEVRNNPNWQNIRVAEVKWKPNAIFVNGHMQRTARWPKLDKAMYSITSGDATAITDDVHLTQPQGSWEGGTLVVRGPSGFREVPGRIVKYDAKAHRIVVDEPRKFDLKPGEHLYFIRNAMAVISEPGQYVLDTVVTPHKLYLWPSAEGNPEQLAIEGSKRARGRILVAWGTGVGHVVIDGLEVAYGEGGGIGSKARGGHHVKVLNCVVHHNRGHTPGISLRNQSDCLVRRCISFKNESHGLSIGRSKDCAAEENEIFDNGVDGIVVATCNDIRLARNYVHDQWCGGHPDGMQTFSGVDRLTMDSNLFMNCGQIWQCANTYNSTMVNNIFVGSHGGGLSITPRSFKGHRPNEKHQWKNNTMAFFVTGGLNIVKDFRITNNVIAPGGYGLMSGPPGHAWISDHNLFWSPARPLVGWKGKTERFEKYRELSGQDKHSEVADPRFRNAPVSYRSGDTKKGPWYDIARNANTASKLWLRFGKGDYEVGDFVEVNWDGVPRKVTKVGDGYIVIDPPLARQPRAADFVVGNWKKNTNIALDLRLEDDSPGKKMGDDGKDVGSNIDIQAYMRGDFDGDGKRDLPPLPKDLLQTSETTSRAKGR